MYNSDNNMSKPPVAKKHDLGGILLIAGGVLLALELVAVIVNLLFLGNSFVNTESVAKIILSVCINILPGVAGAVLAVLGIYMTKKAKGENTIAIKRSIYSLFLSLIFIIGVILVIALSTSLATRYPLDIDLTTNKLHSISNDNFDYISNVEEKINVYVTATEDQYNSVTSSAADIAYIAAANHVIDYNPDNAQYYVQTVELLKKYADYNENITVTFLDLYDSKTREITDNFEDYAWGQGDILVESTFQLNGKDVTRRTVVPFIETYTLEDTSGYADELAKNPEYYELYAGISAKAGYGYGYFITENNIEYMLSAAIYKVTSPDTPLFLVPTSISNQEGIAEALQHTLEVNNFAVDYNDAILSTLLVAENYDKYDGIILSNCKSDITAADRELIENFLNNNGKKGKSLFYFAGVNAASLTNLCGLLGDWGIGFEEGILYETNSNFHASGDPTKIIFESSGSDFTTTSDSLNKYGVAHNLTNMKVLWQSNTSATHTRETHVLMSTASLGMTAVMPPDAKVTEWEAPKDGLDKRILGVASEDADAIDNVFVTSYVVAFASSEIISEDYGTNSYCNLNLTLDTFNHVTGNDDAPFTFVPKKIETSTFYGDVTEGETKAIRIIFIATVPLLVIGLGIFVWIWRKRK